MNGSGKRADLSKLLNMRLVIVEVRIAETNDEAWLRHLTIHPEDLHANIRIFHHQKIVQEQKDFET